MVLVLAGLPLLARRFFGSAGDSRTARVLRVGGNAAILALIAAKATVEQFTFAPPRRGVLLRVYRIVGPASGDTPWRTAILFLVVMALYAAAILWLTSQRSRVAPGTGVGIAVGVVVVCAWTPAEAHSARYSRSPVAGSYHTRIR